MSGTPKFCTACGATLRDNIRFCESCGQSVANVSPAPALSTQGVYRPPAPAMSTVEPPNRVVSPRRPSIPGIVAGALMILGMLMWAGVETLRVLTSKAKPPIAPRELLGDIIVVVCGLVISGLVLSGARKMKMTAAFLGTLLLGTFCGMDLANRLSNIRFILADPIGNFQKEPDVAMRIIQFASAASVGDCMILLSGLLVLIAFLLSLRKTL